MSGLSRPKAGGPLRSSWRLTDIRRWLGVSRIPRLAAVVLVAVVLGHSVQQARTHADATRARWTATPTWVTTTALEAGQRLAPDDIEVRDLPAAAAPTDAVRHDPVGRRARDDLAAGEILREARLRTDDRSRLAAVLPDRAGVVLLDDAAPHLSPGDRVDLHGRIDGRRIAPGAEVVAIIDDVPAVAVDSDDLPRLVVALSVGGVVAILVG